MDFIHFCQINTGELKLEKFDLVLSVHSNQTRCTYIPTNFNLQNAGKIQLFIKEKGKPGRETEKNDDVFRKAGFKKIYVNDPYKIPEKEEIEKIFNSLSGQSINILVDYTFMPRKWIAAILDFFTHTEPDIDILNIFFFYTPVPDYPVYDRMTLKHIGPLNNISRDIPKNKPVTLIAGLGVNPEVTIKTIASFKPGRIFLFIPVSNCSDDYKALIFKNNKEIIERTGEENIMMYSPYDTEEMDSRLTSLCLEQRITSKVVILPQGPVPFSLIALLLAIRYPDIIVWEVIYKTRAQLTGRSSINSPVIAKLVFSNSEDNDY